MKTIVEFINKSLNSKDPKHCAEELALLFANLYKDESSKTLSKDEYYEYFEQLGDILNSPGSLLKDYKFINVFIKNLKKFEKEYNIKFPDNAKDDMYVDDFVNAQYKELINKSH